eukprot:11115104-Lingulodinium_polyedra.AAC.1
MASTSGSPAPRRSARLSSQFSPACSTRSSLCQCGYLQELCSNEQIRFEALEKQATEEEAQAE